MEGFFYHFSYFTILGYHDAYFRYFKEPFPIHKKLREPWHKYHHYNTAITYWGSSQARWPSTLKWRLNNHTLDRLGWNPTWAEFVCEFSSQTKFGGFLWVFWFPPPPNIAKLTEKRVEHYYFTPSSKRQNWPPQYKV